jgi:hypothetical protein
MSPPIPSSWLKTVRSLGEGGREIKTPPVAIIVIAGSVAAGLPVRGAQKAAEAR